MSETSPSRSIDCTTCETNVIVFGDNVTDEQLKEAAFQLGWTEHDGKLYCTLCTKNKTWGTKWCT